MKDTDTITIEITVLQARYLRRKFKDWSGTKKAAARRAYAGPVHDRHKDDAMMLEGLAVYLEEKLK